MLAELDAPPPSSVYDVPEVRDELTAFLAAWLPSVGDQDVRSFKSNLAFLLDLALAHALDPEIVRMGRKVATLVGAEGSGRPRADAVLALLADRPHNPLRGRSAIRGATHRAERSKEK